MSNQTVIDNGFLRIVQELRLLKTHIGGTGTSDVSALDTTATNIVGAINEIVAEIAALSAGAAGIDDASTDTDTTWSSSKINQEILDGLLDVKNELLGGAGAAWDTLQELKAMLDASDAGDDAAIATLTTGLGNRLRIDAAQGLSGPQKQFGRDNLDVYSKAEIGDVAYDYVASIESALT